jgi:hypothetical protein
MFLILILALGLYLAPFIKQTEGFKSSTFAKTEGNYPVSVDKAILNDYPLIGKNETSNDSYNDIWWRFPIFSLGSYEQVTNNLKYRYNPDEGTCITADFCGALYHNSKNTKSNITLPLPPAEEGPGARVGYFRTEPNELYYSIPTNENILY